MKQISQHAFMIQAGFSSQRSNTHSTPAASATTTTITQAFDRHHVYYDTLENIRHPWCPEYAEAARKELVYTNDKNHIFNAMTGEELPMALIEVV
jgi:hypothetical protein